MEMEQRAAKDRVVQMNKVTANHRMCHTLCKFIICIFLYIVSSTCNLLFDISFSVLIENVCVF